MKGDVSPRFERVREVLEKQLADGRQLGVALAIYHRGEPVVDVWDGIADETTGGEWERETEAVIFSATKGIVATCLHMLVDRGKVAYDEPVSKYWPEFGQHGKEAITVRQVLTHQAGIPQQPDGLGVEDMVDWGTMARAMEDLTPLWEPGTKTGYHAVNFGWLVGEIVRRVDGRSIGTFLREEVAGPLGLEHLHIGLPEGHEANVARLRRPTTELSPAMQEVLARWGDPDSIPGKVIPPQIADMSDFMNSPEAHRAEIPATSGIATARDLARLYACLGAGGTLDGVTLTSAETIAAATKRETFRQDEVLSLELGWALGYGTGGTPISVAGLRVTAFGHSGYGGSIGFADPEIEMSFGYVPNALALDLVGDVRAKGLADAARACVEGKNAPLTDVTTSHSM